MFKLVESLVQQPTRISTIVITLAQSPAVVLQPTPLKEKSSLVFQPHIPNITPVQAVSSATLMVVKCPSKIVIALAMSNLKQDTQSQVLGVLKTGLHSSRTSSNNVLCTWQVSLVTTTLLQTFQARSKTASQSNGNAIILMMTTSGKDITLKVTTLLVNLFKIGKPTT